MAKKGDSYIVQIEEAHLMWGEYHPCRHSHSRRETYGEGYIKIPSTVAYDYCIFNNNNPYEANTLYSCKSYDGYYKGTLLAQGNQDDPIYAKQFAEKGNLKGIGDWYDYVGADVGDFVKVVFTAPNKILIEYNKDEFSFHI